MNKKISIVIGVVAIAAIALFVFGGKGKEADITKGNENEATSTPAASESNSIAPSAAAGSTQTVPMAADVEEAIKKAIADAMVSANSSKKAAPTIATSPYTIYLGFATDYGTSSKSVMDRESRDVVVGYEWESLGGSPEITMVKLPLFDIRNDGDETEYAVQAFDDKAGAYVSLGEFRSGEEIRYVREGSATMRKFKVAIPSTLRICPGDRGFNWIFRFANSSDIGVVRTPITERLPGSETCVMR